MTNVISLVLQSTSDLLVTSAFVGHIVSAHHQFANGTYFTSSALVLKFSSNKIECFTGGWAATFTYQANWKSIWKSKSTATGYQEIDAEVQDTGLSRRFWDFLFGFFCGLPLHLIIKIHLKNVSECHWSYLAE